MTKEHSSQSQGLCNRVQTGIEVHVDKDRAGEKQPTLYIQGSEESELETRL